MAFDALILNGVNVNDGVNYFLGDGYDTGSGSVEQVSLSSLLVDGEVLSGARTGNRSFTVPVVVRGSGRISMAQAVGVLSRAVNAETWTLRHEPAGGLPIAYDCYRASVSKTSSFKHEKFGLVTQLTVTFQAQPFGRNPVLTTTTQNTSNMSAILPTVKGTARTPARVELDLPPDTGRELGWDILLAVFSGMASSFDPYVFYGGNDGVFTVDVDLPSANFRPGTYQIWAHCQGLSDNARTQATVSQVRDGGSAFTSEPVQSSPFNMQPFPQSLRTRFLGQLEMPALPVAGGATGVTFHLQISNAPDSSTIRFRRVFLIPADGTVAFVQGWRRNAQSTMVFESQSNGTLQISAGATAAQAVGIMDLALSAGVITLDPGQNRLFVNAALDIDLGQGREVLNRVSYYERFHFDRDTLDAAGYGGGYGGGYT